MSVKKKNYNIGRLMKSFQILVTTIFANSYIYAEDSANGRGFLKEASFFQEFEDKSIKNINNKINVKENEQSEKLTGAKNNSQSEKLTGAKNNVQSEKLKGSKNNAQSEKLIVAKNNTINLDEIKSNNVAYSIPVVIRQDNDQNKKLLQKINIPTALNHNFAPNKAISLKDAVTMSLLWHPKIKRSQSEVLRNQEAIKEVRSQYFPTLGLRVQTGFEQDNNDENQKTNRIVLNAKQLIYDFGKSRSKGEFAKASFLEATSSLENDTANIAYETVSAYLQTIRYKKLVEIAKEQVLGFQRINEIARLRAQLGASAQADYFQSKVRLTATEVLLNDYQTELQRWSETLNNIVNSRISDNTDLDFPNIPSNTCLNVKNSELSSPVLKMAEAQVLKSNSQVEAAKSEFFPSLSLDPQYSYDIDNDDNSYTNNKKGSFGVFVNLNMPLFEGGRISSRYKQAKETALSAQYNLDNEKNEARKIIDIALSQIANSQASLLAKQQREYEATRTRDLYKLQYLELGTRSLSDLLSSESEIHQTKIEIINSQFTILGLSLDCLHQSEQITEFFVGN